MIEADWDVAARDKNSGGNTRLVEPLGGARQLASVDQALMWLEPGHMGVPKQGQPMRAQRGGALCTVLDIRHRLTGKSIHQIDVEAVYARVPEQRDGSLDLRQRLHSANRCLDMRRQVLHSEARPIDSN